MTTKLFNGETELKLASMHFVGRQRFAEPVDYTPHFDREAGRWVHNYVPVERVINYSNRPSRHECDARCMNAKGRTMNCECACGGKNHGKGHFVAEAA